MLEFFRELSFDIGQEIYFKYLLENPTGMFVEVAITFLLWALIKNRVLSVLAQIANAALWFLLAYFLFLHGHEVLAVAYAAIIPMMIYLFFDAERSAKKREVEKAEKRARSRKKSGRPAPAEKE